MIDRKSRDLLAVGLRRYLAGLISNDDLDFIRVDYRDRGVVSVKERSWGLYSDLSHHYAKDAYALSLKDKREIIRWIAFLYTDQEYLWEAFPSSSPIKLVVNFIARRVLRNGKTRTFVPFGEAEDLSIWPFFTRAAYEEALSRPRLLAGTRGSRE